MVTVRRWSVYLVCAVSLNTAAWAAITLLRNLLTPGREAPLASTAFQIAVVVVGLPVFLVHWLWAQRLARQEADERQSALRRLYLYGTMAGFLGPFLANAFNLIVALLRPVSRGGGTLLLRPLVPPLVGLGALGLLWFYHWRVRREDGQTPPEGGTLATLQRLYLFGFSAAGLALTSLAAIHLLRWLLFQFGASGEVIRASGASLAAEVARMAVGLPVWLFFWGRAQRLFAGAEEEERESALRKFYLYGAVLVAVLSAVTNVTVILAGGLRRVLDLPAMGDIRLPLPIAASMAVVWAYHARTLRLDADRAAEAPRQAGIRRLYLYLVAGVGLAALLVGLSGTLSALIKALAASFLGPALKEQLAWYSAALIAGLPVWLLPWRRAQLGAVAAPFASLRGPSAGGAGAEARGSVVRKIYLYFYLFVATMTVLSSAVYIVSQL
ncbi:MAG: hypothetical protein HY784_14330, partial [Chloroflexi bacterium]|nr:hypothetical protein [Chloroflexota bacterium]